LKITACEDATFPFHLKRFRNHPRTQTERLRPRAARHRPNDTSRRCGTRPGNLPLCKVPRRWLELGEKLNELLRGALASTLPTVQQVFHGLPVASGTGCRVDIWKQEATRLRKAGLLLCEPASLHTSNQWIGIAQPAASLLPSRFYM
jgi:hypothetical protein